MSQQGFTAALLQPDLPEPIGLTDGHGAPAGKRFSVYRNNVTVSLIDALCDGFPACTKLIGEENMRNIAREYLRNEPPTSPMMMFYGAGFAAFLQDFPPLAKYGYLPDVARLEYAMRESYHAADSTPIAPDALGAIAPEKLGDLRLTLAPTLRILRSDWPVHALWMFNMADGPKPQAEAQSVLIARPEFDPTLHRLGLGAPEFIEALMLGHTLGIAAEIATAAEPEFDLSIALGLLISTKSIIKLSHEGET